MRISVLGGILILGSAGPEISHDLGRFRQAIFAKSTVFDVDPFDRVGRGHDAAEVVAMVEVKCVA